MNNHDDIRKLLPAYCRQELDPAERLRVEQHLSACPECSAALADLETTLRLMRSTPQVEPPPWMTSRIMARLREETAQKRSWLQRIFFPLHIKLPLELMALLVVCVSGYFLARNVETEMQRPIPQLRQAPVPSPAPVPETAPHTLDAPPLKQESAVTREKQTAPPQAAPEEKPAQSAEKKQELHSPPAPRPPSETRPALPPPAESVPQRPPATYAPAPPSPSVRVQDYGAPVPGLGFESNLSAPPMQSNDRAQEAEPSLRKKSSKGREAEKSESSTVSRLPQVRFRLSPHNPAMADDLVRQAINRSGGTLVEGVRPSERHLKTRIPSTRLPELLDRLERLGRITERPALPGPGVMVEVEIFW